MKTVTDLAIITVYRMQQLRVNQHGRNYCGARQLAGAVIMTAS